MSDEEKKAIEHVLLSVIEAYSGYEGLQKISEEYKDTKTILNLIEKQSKEIEELKENMRKRVKYCNELEKDLFENCSNYVVSKDKIRAKIEIRKEEKENCKDSIEEKYLLREIYILQSLLEEED